MLFIPNDLYSHEDIYRSLGVGNAGGIRFCTDRNGQIRRAVLMTAAPNARIQRENPYHDRLEGNILVYTGAGQEGNQTLGGRNRRLLEQASNPFPIYCFQLLGSRRNKDIGVKRWRFIGFLDYIRHYKETQIDIHENSREVCVFEFLVLSGFEWIYPEQDLSIVSQLIADSRRLRELNEDERQIVKPASISDDLPQKVDPVFIERVRCKMLLMSPENFEHLIKDVLICCGFCKVHVTRYSQDGGIDVNAFAGQTMWPIRNLLIQIQAKRWMHTVGRKEVAELRGSLQRFARGAVVTTSQFSKAAIAEATDQGKQPIVLVDGFDFAQIAAKNGALAP